MLGDDGKPTGRTQLVEEDQGIRETSLEALAQLKPVVEGGIHTAGNSSQISDGAAAILWMTAEKAQGARAAAARAHPAATSWSAPIPTTCSTARSTRPSAILKKTGMKLSDIDLIEINEAFAAVVLSWARVFEPDMDRVNVNGGAIALGHPVGATGSRLIVTALHELERRGLGTAFITMCCGASVGTGTIIERL